MDSINQLKNDIFLKENLVKTDLQKKAKKIIKESSDIDEWLKTPSSMSYYYEAENELDLRERGIYPIYNTNIEETKKTKPSLWHRLKSIFKK